MPGPPLLRAALTTRLSTQRAISRSGFHNSSLWRQQQQQQQSERPRTNPHVAHANFYKTHGRAMFKSLTLAFFTFQCFYWAWVTLETEELRDGKEMEIKSLEGEVRLLEEGRSSHRPSEQTSR